MLDLCRVFAQQQRFEIRFDQVRARDLILPAPARRTGSLAYTREAFVRMHSHQQKRGNSVRSTTPAADRKFRLERNTDGYRFDASDFHRDKNHEWIRINTNEKSRRKKSL